MAIGVPLGQFRAAPIDLGNGAPRAFVAAYSQERNIDPDHPNLRFPKDSLKLIVFDESGRIHWRRELGPGVWATTGTRENLPAPIYLGSFPGTMRGSESGLHPVTAFDAATGHAFVSVMDAGTKRAVYTVHRPKDGWIRGYTAILPAGPTPQGTLRQGPAIADVPGPGVLALVRDGEQKWYLRHLTPDDIANPIKSK